MAFNFPNNPSNGDTHQEGGLTWTWDGSTWKSSGSATGGGGASVTVADAAPSGPNSGDLWWKSDEGQLKIFYVDANTSQWVDAAGGGVGSGGSSVTYDLQGRNTTSTNAFVDLVPSSGTTDSIEFTGSGGSSISWDNANKRITITSTAPVNSDWNSASGLSQILNKPTIPPAYTLPIATAGVIGGVRIGNNLTIDPSTGVLDAVQGSYTLPTAGVGAAGTLGGVKVDGSSITIDGNGVIASGTGSSVPAVTDIPGTTGVVASNSSVELNITGYKAYSIFKIKSSVEAWIRVYVDDASRDADINRSEGNDPSPSGGVVCEVRTTGANQSVLTIPGVQGCNNDDPRTDQIYLSVTNRSNSTTAITVTLTAVQIGD